MGLMAMVKVSWSVRLRGCSMLKKLNEVNVKVKMSLTIDRVKLLKCQWHTFQKTATDGPDFSHVRR